MFKNIGYFLRHQKRYSKTHLLKDLMAGVVVSFVSLPLAIAIGIATGVRPENAITTAVVLGVVCALFGGTKYMVSGPTAAFIVILHPVYKELGQGGLILAGFLAGVLLLILSFTNYCKISKFLSEPIVLGFTSGIAVVIGYLQIKDCLGLGIFTGDNYLRYLSLYKGPELFISTITLVGLVVISRALKKIPSPIIVFPLLILFTHFIFKNHFDFQTIYTKFGQLTQEVPTFKPPWTGDFQDVLSRNLLGAVFSVILMASMESLVTAKISDQYSKVPHKSDSEIFALGLGNIISSVFQGIPGCGAVSRTITNIKFGAYGPISATISALMVLLIYLLASKVLTCIPIAALAALLVYVCYTLFNPKELLHKLKQFNKNEKTLFIIVALLTVFKSLVAAVILGFIFQSIIGLRSKISK